MKLGRSRRKNGDQFAKPQMTSLVDVLTVLVFFLLKNFSSEGDIVTQTKNLELPMSSSKAKPEQMLNIAISAKHILVEGTPVALVTEEQERDGNDIPGSGAVPGGQAQADRGDRRIRQERFVQRQADHPGGQVDPLLAAAEGARDLRRQRVQQLFPGGDEKRCRLNPKEKPGSRPPEESRRGYRGGIFDHIDVPAITSFTVCLLLFILILVGIRSVDYSSLNKPSLEDLSDRVSKIIMPLKPPGKALPKPEAPKVRRRPGRAAGARGRAGRRLGPGTHRAFAARRSRSRSARCRSASPRRRCCPSCPAKARRRRGNPWDAPRAKATSSRVGATWTRSWEASKA